MASGRGALALAMVQFCFPGQVDINEVVEGLPWDAKDSDMRFLMPCLEDAANTILAIAPFDAILHGPSPDHKW